MEEEEVFCVGSGDRFSSGIYKYFIKHWFELMNYIDDWYIFTIVSFYLKGRYSKYYWLNPFKTFW